MLEERITLTNVVDMVKIDQDLFAVFDQKGSLRFLSIEDAELVKFKTSLESKNETEEVLPLL